MVAPFCRARSELPGWWEYRMQLSQEFARLLVSCSSYQFQIKLEITSTKKSYRGILLAVVKIPPPHHPQMSFLIEDCVYKEISHPR